MNNHPSSPSSAHYDVTVIGGGPGGAALATFLARQGRRCLVLEQSSFPRYPIGESLVPHTYGILDRLGFLPKLKAAKVVVDASGRGTLMGRQLGLKCDVPGLKTPLP